MIRAMIYLIIGVLGMYMLGAHDGWWDAFGAFFLIMAHQIEKHYPT